MKTKKLIMTVAVFSILALFPIIANAERDWYTCTVKKVGVAQTSCYICLADTGSPPTFNGTFFKFEQSREKEMLATALTAAANGFNVQIYADLDQSKIYCLYVVVP